MKLNHMMCWGLLLASSFTFVSCDKNADNTQSPKQTQVENSFKGLLFSSMITNSEGNSGQVYLQSIPALGVKTHYDNTQGIPAGFGGTSIALENGHIYVFPDYMGNSKSEITRYSVDSNGHFHVEGKLQIPASAAACNIVELNDEKAYLSMQALNKIYVFNPKTMTKIKEINFDAYNGTETKASPAAMVIRDGMLFAGLSQFDSQWMPRAKQINIAVIDTQTDQVKKVATNTTLGFSSTTRPIDRYSIFKDEQGDIYFYCVGAWGFNPEFPGGIARIKHGSEDIDPTYSIDLAKTPVIDGDNHHITCIHSMYYAGNGIAYGYGTDTALDPEWMNRPYTAIINIPLEINLKDKTFKRIKELPASGPQTFYITQHQGKILFASSNTKANGIYSYDPKSKKVEGPLFTTDGTPNFIYSYSK